MIRAYCSACGHKGDCTHDGERAHCPKCGNSWRHFLPANYAPAPAKPLGPGTALHRTLARFGIRESADCGCKSHAAEMDRWGPDGCEANMETILAWIRAACEHRGVMYVGFIARLLVRRAIKQSRASG